jgi:hypothetical protein
MCRGVCLTQNPDSTKEAVGISVKPMSKKIWRKSCLILFNGCKAPPCCSKPKALKLYGSGIAGKQTVPLETGNGPTEGSGLPRSRCQHLRSKIRLFLDYLKRKLWAFRDLERNHLLHLDQLSFFKVRQDFRVCRSLFGDLMQLLSGCIRY